MKLNDLAFKLKREEIMKESKLLRGLIVSAATIVVATALPATASATAESGLKGKAVKVSYSDLNIEKEAGVKVLYRRLKQASKQACGVESLKIAGSVRAMSETQRCYRETLAAVVDKIDNSELTRIHES